MSMTDIRYPHPPIVEAVVEFKFSASTDEKKYAKVLTNLKKAYDVHKEETHYTYAVDMKAPYKEPKKTTQTVDKLFSNNMTQNIIMRSNSLAISQLAPYACWDEFRARIFRDFEVWHRAVGYQQLERIGMRYINRIDLPLEDDKIQLEQYAVLNINVQPCLKSLDKYSINIQSQLKDIGATVIVNSAMVESPLANHLSLVLDFDIFRMVDSSMKVEDIFTYLDQARTKKNELFESSITEKAREIFRRER